MLIHHKDENRQNDISNLEIISWGAHTILHRTKTYEELQFQYKCPCCGSRYFIYVDEQRFDRNYKSTKGDSR